ncbi:3-keto-disaccharide hydrolase [Robertkochia aurantiaca]|uniref:3-keto-disaccharide hydrolase n=1 Tax=Robertkochia aurantiaca TaxID=2873700 RepID=UPI001CCD74DD|nr:DUF1080 domain-containing protein [Robertkochia sp. 3YJGBD-33]
MPEGRELFNGRDLEGWTPKISGQHAGTDSLNTFRVEDGSIVVSYDNYDSFDNQFGHLFYNEPFTSYLLELEYRFTGEQMADGEPWANRNSGVMYHSQSPQSMLKEQAFPVSLEGQFLGGVNEENRPTMNLCTPGTHVFIADTLFTPHCVNSSSETYFDDQWVRASFLVLGDSLVQHFVNHEKVLEFTKPQRGGELAEDAAAEFKKPAPLKDGYIALQSESHPVAFRKIKIFDLEGRENDTELIESLLFLRDSSND